MRYFIIGFKNSGKTTFGRRLASGLHMNFIDLDEYIESKENNTIPEIFTSLGEADFRKLEWKALKEVITGNENIVISTGGGAPCHCDNMSLMEKYGDVIYLNVSDKILIDRLKHAAKDRPIVLGKNEEQIRQYVSDLRQRCEHHYKRAKYIINGDQPDLESFIKVIKQ